MLREVASGVIPGRPWLAWTPEARSQKRDSAAVRGFAVVERAAKSHPDDGALERLLTRGVEMPSEAVRGLMEFIKKQGQVERNPMSRGVAESTARYGADARIEGTPTNDAALALKSSSDFPRRSLGFPSQEAEGRSDGVRMTAGLTPLQKSLLPMLQATAQLGGGAESRPRILSR